MDTDFLFCLISDTVDSIELDVFIPQYTAALRTWESQNTSFVVSNRTPPTKSPLVVLIACLPGYCPSARPFPTSPTAPLPPVPHAGDLGVAHLALQLEDAVHEGLAGRGAAGDVDVDGDDAVAAADDAVAVVVVAAAVGAAAHGDDPAGVGHLIVDLAQGGGHLVGEGAGDDHDVRLAGEARKMIPRRSWSYRGVERCIISTAQQARPKVMGQREDWRAQLAMTSREVLFVFEYRDSVSPTNVPLHTRTQRERGDRKSHGRWAWYAQRILDDALGALLARQRDFLARLGERRGAGAVRCQRARISAGTGGKRGGGSEGDEGSRGLGCSSVVSLPRTRTSRSPSMPGGGCSGGHRGGRGQGSFFYLAGPLRPLSSSTGAS
ncbi:hypothetical protein ACCO45_012898 [Purpureocillium lilacinum]|uniref:Uncharacterized protein n=1 Tax=Purpureocillium lilacinum TaxID=33203 RepID=A0ACC4DCC8_PURLI